jgi:hypothetical protein
LEVSGQPGEAQVRANVTHGLPLSLADRKAAAVRILQIHPQWSDRAIAAAAGLSPATVRSIRECATDCSGQLHTLVGRDGRQRPVDTSVGRQRAAEVLAQRPEASLREVARCSGVSVSTVRDVRQRLQTGQNPAPQPGRNVGRPAARPVVANGGGPEGIDRTVTARSTRPQASILADLTRDPSLRYSVTGRAVLHWLDAHRVSLEDWAQLRDAIPARSATSVAELAVSCARVWTQCR